MAQGNLKMIEITDLLDDSAFMEQIIAMVCFFSKIQTVSIAFETA